jgi:hypothetical protein
MSKLRVKNDNFIWKFMAIILMKDIIWMNDLELLIWNNFDKNQISLFKFLLNMFWFNMFWFNIFYDNMNNLINVLNINFDQLKIVSEIFSLIKITKNVIWIKFTLWNWFTIFASVHINASNININKWFKFDNIKDMNKIFFESKTEPDNMH